MRRGGLAITQAPWIFLVYFALKDAVSMHHSLESDIAMRLDVRKNDIKWIWSKIVT